MGVSNLRLLGLCAAAAVVAIHCARAAEPLVFAAVEDLPDGVVASRVLEQAYATLGYTISFEYYPAQDALRASNSGLVDGELQRIDGLSSQYIHLIQIGIPINYIQGAVFSLKEDVKISNWHELRPYRIGIVKGVVFSERGTRNMNRTVVETYPELIELLIGGQVDFIIASLISGLTEVEKTDSTGGIKLSGVVESRLVYHYLHDEHRDLVPEIERVLKTMLLSGEITRIRKEVLEPLYRALEDKAR